MTKKDYSKYEAKEELGLYPLTMCYFIKRTQKCTKLFINHFYRRIFM